jgi:hypothetical protein
VRSRPTAGTVPVMSLPPDPAHYEPAPSADSAHGAARLLGLATFRATPSPSDGTIRDGSPDLTLGA